MNAKKLNPHEAIDFQHLGRVGTITLDDGKVNALGPDKWYALEQAFDLAEEKNLIVVIKGREGIFSGGFDLKEIQKGVHEAVELTAQGSRFARRILSFPCPVIGVSTGHCIAMGAFLMLACDYRIGVDGDYKVGLNETMIGMTMHHFGLELARSRLPNNFFNRCVFNAEMFSPMDAVGAGFYDLVVPEKDLEKSVFSAVKEFEGLSISAFKGSKTKGRVDLMKLLDECIEKDLIL